VLLVQFAHIDVFGGALLPFMKLVLIPTTVGPKLKAD
jgi:hypothetical protein